MITDSTAIVEIEVNGKLRTVSPGWTLIDLVTDLELPAEQVAIEVNRRIVQRRQWRRHRLQKGDSLEIVHFVGGG